MKKRLFTLFIFIIILIMTLVGCTNESNGKKIKSIDDIPGSKIGVLTGSYAATVVYKEFPNNEIKEFATNSDMLMALSQGKVDVCLHEESLYYCMKWEGMDYDRLEEPYQSTDFGIAFKKGKHKEVQAQLNEYIAKIKENGEFEKLNNKWFSDEEPTEFLNPNDLNGSNGTLKVAALNAAMPFGYIKNGKIVGYDIDILVSFAKEYGYKLDITGMTFSSILTSLQSEMYDIAVAGLTITDERRETMDFTDTYHVENLIFIVPGDGSETAGFFDIDNLKDSFDKTFVRESRWKLIVEGVITTLTISLFAVLGGTVFGFALYLLSRSKYKAIRNFTKVFSKIYSSIIAGTPTLVILMILFYVVFGSSGISGVMVAIIGFILIFAAFVYNQLCLTVSGVDNGQTEAAYALGYSKNQTFFKIVLPQAMKMFLPTYSGEIVSLIKATSVVGYIAVNDLTKMGDIIRGSTYEAFFPLITVALIYFVIIWVITLLLKMVQKKLDPRRKKQRNLKCQN